MAMSVRSLSAAASVSALLAAILALSACATTLRPHDTSYVQMGGAAGIEGIVDDLLDIIVEDERINFQFAQTDIVRFREKLIEQLCVETDGPCAYTGQTMHESHAGRHIDDAQFNALVEDLTDVMEARRLPIAAQNQLIKRLAAMHAQIVEPRSTRAN